ncbi:MAG: hypothetical protein ACKVX7_03790 [Planctomycetota bacterium]
MIEQLGNQVWIEREEATQRLLALGRDAVVELRRRQTHPNPEIRTRVEWLLEVVDPPVHTVVLLRLDGALTAGVDRLEPLVATEWLTLDVVGSDAEASGTTLNATNVAMTHLSIGVRDARNPPTLTIAFDGDAAPPRVERSLSRGQVVVLREEQLVEVRNVDSQLLRRAAAGVWLLLLSDARRLCEPRAPDSTPVDLASATDIVRERLCALSCDADSTSAALALAAVAQWGDASLLAKLRAVVPAPTLEWDHHIAQLRGPDSSQSRAALERWFASRSPEELSEPLTIRVALALTPDGFAPAAQLVAERIATLGFWGMHKAVHALTRCVANNSASPELRETVLASLCDVEVLPTLPWFADEGTTVLLRELEQRVPTDVFLRNTLALLEKSPGQNPSTAAMGKGLLAALARAAQREPTRVREFLPTLFALLATRECQEQAFCLVRAEHLRSPLAQEDWQRFLAALEQIYQDGQSAVLSRLDPLLHDWLRSGRLAKAEEHSLWLVRIRALAKAFNRQQIEVDLVSRFGELETPSPAGKIDEAAWQARAEQWRTRLERETDEQNGVGTDATSFVSLTSALFRIDEQAGEAVLVRFTSDRCALGQSILRTAEDGMDRTLRVEETATIRGKKKLYRATGFLGAQLYMRMPVLAARFPPSGVERRFLISDNEFGPRIPSRMARIEYKELLVLDDAPQDSFHDWPDLLAWLVAGSASDDLEVATSCTNVIGQLRLREALPNLRARFATNPQTDLATSLYLLGDATGRDVLLAELRTEKATVLPTLAILIRAGEREAIDLALQWLAAPPAMLRYQGAQILRNLDETSQLRPELVELDRWLAALIASLEQANNHLLACALLQRLSGMNFGYAETFRETDQKVREEAQAQVIEKWRSWYRQRPK